MSRTTRLTTALAVGALIVSAFSTTARALPLGFKTELDPSQSSFNLSLSYSGVVTAQTVSTVSGPAVTDGLDGVMDVVDSVGNVPGSATITGGGFGVSNASSLLDMIFLGQLAFGTQNLHVALAGNMGAVGPPVPDVVLGGTNTYSLAGTSLVFNGGGLSYSATGSVAKLIGTGTFTSMAFPLTGNATVKLSAPGPGGLRNLTISVPVNSSNVLLPFPPSVPVQINSKVTGNLVFTGTRVPEPSTVALLALGLVGMTPVIRRRLQRRRMA